MYEEYFGLLVNNKLTQNIDLSDLNKVLNIINPLILSYKKNTMIKNENDIANKSGFVLEGQVANVKDKKNGDRVIIQVYKPGELFGEGFAFSNDPKWTSSIIAKTDCTILFIHNEWINGTREADIIPYIKFLKNFVAIECDKTNQLSTHLKFFKTKTVREKIASFLLQESHSQNSTTIMLDYDRNELAEFLSIPRPSLSREFSKMKKEGLIDYYKSSIKILNEQKMLDLL